MERGLDFISFLPDHILRQIVSLIPCKEAIRTAVLSDRWRKLWSPLHLNILLDSSSQKLSHESNERLTLIFTHLLKSYEYPEKLQISFQSGDSNKFIAIVTKGTHQDLHFDFSATENTNCRFNFVFDQMGSLNINSPELSSLKNLHLRLVPARAETVLSDLFRNFHFLKSLSLEKCSELKNIDLRANESLTSLTILECCNIENIRFSGPKLRSFIYRGHLPDIQSVNAPILTEVTLNLRDGVGDKEFDCEDVLCLLCCFKDVETLTISGWLIEWLCSAGVIFEHLEFKFNRLKELWCVNSAMDKRKRDSIACFLDATPIIEKLFVKLSMKQPVISFGKRFISSSNFHLAANIRSKHASVATIDIESSRKGDNHHLNLKAAESNIVNASGSESNASWNALHLFDDLSQYDVVSATSLLGQFAKQDRHRDAVSLFSRFLELNIKPNHYTFGTVLPSATVLKDIDLGRQLQAFAIKIGVNCNVFAGSAILDFYVKLTNIEEAQKAFDEIDSPNVVSYTTLMNGYLREEKFEEAIRLFERIPERNVVSWNALISGCSQRGKNEEAVNLFIQMLRDGVVPSQSTFPCAIIAAANIAALGMGRSFHACAFKFLGNLSVFIGNALVSFYAKCGEMEDSLLAFGKLCKKNVVSWNAMICGYAQNGDGKEAINMFEKMKCSGIRPNDVTILGLLLACNHCGLVDEGCWHFNQAKVEYPDMMKPEHYACVVDMLSRSGRFKEAEKFVADLPFDPGIGFWKAILGGCQNFLNIELGELAAGKIIELDPRDVSSYVMISNAHSAAGRWQIVSGIRQQMKEKGMSRIPGCSWIEIKSQIHVFVTGDMRHAQKDQIYEVLRFFLAHEAQQRQDINLGP